MKSRRPGIVWLLRLLAGPYFSAFLVGQGLPLHHTCPKNQFTI